jgi:hypothetical protein
MPESVDQLIERVTERFERRMAEETGALRLEIASGDASLRAELEKGHGVLRAEMENGFGTLRAEMIDRNATILRWLLVYGLTQIATIAALLSLFR